MNVVISIRTLSYRFTTINSLIRNKYWFDGTFHFSPIFSQISDYIRSLFSKISISPNPINLLKNSAKVVEIRLFSNISWDNLDLWHKNHVFDFECWETAHISTRSYFGFCQIRIVSFMHNFETRTGLVGQTGFDQNRCIVWSDFTGFCQESVNDWLNCPVSGSINLYFGKIVFSCWWELNTKPLTCILCILYQLSHYTHKW